MTRLKVAKPAQIGLAIILAGCSSAVTPAAPSRATTAIPVTIVATAPRIQPAATVQSPTASPQPAPATPKPETAFIQLTNGECCVQPFFSPDGSQVLYLDKPAADEPAGIWAVATDKPLSLPVLLTERFGPFSRDLSLALDLAGGRTTVERLSDGQRWMINNGGRSVSFSPDAKRIAWSVQDEVGGFDVRRSELWIANADGTDARRVAMRYGGGSLAWFPDSQRMLIGGRARRNDASAALSILDLASGNVRDVIPVERLRSPALSPDGRWLAYFVGQAREPGKDGMYLLDLTQATPTPKRLEFFGAYRWRDANRLLYIPLKPGAPSNELWQLDAATGQAQPLIAASPDSPFKIANGDWDVSRDGAKLLFLSARDRNIWLASLP